MAEEDAPPATNVISGEAQPESQTEVLYVPVSYTHLTLPTIYSV